MFDYKDMKATIIPRSEFKYWFRAVVAIKNI